jgi:large subunit ribosomal protein L29
MMDKKELINLDKESLNKEIASLRKELFNLKMNRISGQVKDTSQFKKLRIQVARIQTFLKSKEQ